MSFAYSHSILAAVGPSSDAVQSGHYSEDEWEQYLNDAVEPEKCQLMDDHLGSCPSCAEALLDICPSNTDFFGRPTEAPTNLLAPSIKKHLERLTTQLGDVGERLSSESRPFICAGEWYSEAALHYLLQLVLGRFKRKGLSVQIKGHFHALAGAPERPPLETEVVVLLEAPGLPDWQREWSVKRRGQLVVLVGLSEDWERINTRPDFLLSEDDPWTIQISMMKLQHLQHQYLTGEQTFRMAYLASALGCDFPSHLLGEELPQQFGSVRRSRGKPEGWCSLPTPWAAYRALLSILQVGNHDLLVTRDFRALKEQLNRTCPACEICRRLAFRWEQRGLERFLD